LQTPWRIPARDSNTKGYVLLILVVPPIYSSGEFNPEFALSLEHTSISLGVTPELDTIYGRHIYVLFAQI